MKLEVYSVFDEKAECFGTPFFTNNDSLARRMFNDLANDPNSTLYRHPEDFKLYHIGTFDNETSELVPQERPLFLCHAPMRKEHVQTADQEPILTPGT